MPVKKVVGKSKTTWYYSFRVRGVRYRGAIPEATNKQQAEQAETKIRNEIYEGKFGRATTALPLKEFVDQVYRPWAKSNKRSWNIDESRLKPIVDFFGKKRLNEINTFLVEKFKRERKAFGGDHRPSHPRSTPHFCYSRSRSRRSSFGDPRRNGHKSIKTTERYSYATDEAKRRAVEALHSASTGAGTSTSLVSSISSFCV